MTQHLGPACDNRISMVEGDIVKKRWDATAAEANEIREQYADDPSKSVQVEPR